MTLYDSKFYEIQQGDSLQSARQMVPYVLRYVQPKSVVDAGCGVGTWLSVFKEHGVKEILGVDGDYVDPAMLHIAPSEFLARDLSQPFSTERTFDLAMSLEVAEHLPETSAEGFVDSLTRLAPVVLFSAAVPFQGGVNHINERWPDYWMALFAKRDFVLVDCLRKATWNLPGIKPHYPQNAFIYVRRACLGSYDELRGEFEKAASTPLALVHPGLFEYQMRKLTAEKELKPGNFRLRTVLAALPNLAAFEIRGALRSFLGAVAPGLLRVLRDRRRARATPRASGS